MAERLACAGERVDAPLLRLGGAVLRLDSLREEQQLLLRLLHRCGVRAELRRRRLPQRRHLRIQRLARLVAAHDVRLDPLGDAAQPRRSLVQRLSLLRQPAVHRAALLDEVELEQVARGGGLARVAGERLHLAARPLDARLLARAV